MFRMKMFACLALLVMTIGCNSTRKTFDVRVQNQTSQPVTVWLTKDGPPPEVGWYSPEQLGEMPNDTRARYDLAIVPPGKSGYTGKMTGEFPAGTRAVLRIYPGAMELFHILEAAKTGGGQHSDFVLKPGTNKLAVVDQGGGQLAVEPIGGR